MARLAILQSLIFCCLLQFTSASDTLYLYTESTLGNITASESCISALTSNVTCYTSLNKAVTQTTSWGSIALSNICADKCTDSLTEYVAAVDDACGSSTYNISGTLQVASRAGQELIWKQTVTCLKDDSTDEYCNTEFQDAAVNGTGVSEIGCSQCYLDYLYTIANSEYGQSIVNEDYFDARASSCSATGYTITYTATSTSTSASATATTNVRCNLTDTDTTVYTVQAGDSCLSISASQNVSTALLASTNGLDSNCTFLTTDQSLCLPMICDIYMVQENNTCTSIIDSLSREVNLGAFLSWNSNINSICSNIASLVGTYICASPLGTTTIPDTFSIKAATTAVTVPTNAVTTSNTDCGYWYTIQDDDACADVADTYGIDLDDFYFLNPQLNGTCESLWVGNAYCVEAVGNVHTYSGYTTTRNFTTLASTMDTAATVTVNRSTTHFFYSWAPITTVTSSYNSTIYSIISSYTLCDDALTYYGLEDDDELPDEAYENDDWMEEYERVCEVNPNSALPTLAFNTSIALETDTDTATASTGATATLATATTTGVSASATSTGLSVSPDGTCGSDTGYTCADSTFGDCCSSYGYCGSSKDYCSTYCDSAFGDCDTASPDGTCGGDTGYTCTGSEFGTCCSIYGYCGSSTDYCSTYCDSDFGDCDTATTTATTSTTSTTSAAAASSTSTVSPDGTCGSDNGYTCAGSEFGDCCSIYGYCGSSTDYCSTYCDSSFGNCDA